MARRVPKYAFIAGELRARILSRGLGVGDAIPTEHEIGERFRCSRGTVRRALDQLVHEGLVRRRQGAGHFVARNGAVKRESLFGLMVPNIINSEIVQLAQLLTLEAGRRGYRILLGVTNIEPAIEREFLQEIQRLRVSGVVKFPTDPEMEEETRASLRAMGIPYVVVNDFWSDSSRDCHVAVDEAAAVKVAVDHLVHLGHRRIAWVDRPVFRRHRACMYLKERLASHGLSLREEDTLLYPLEQAPPVERLWSGTRPGPTAVITPYDGMAVKLIEALSRAGRKVPEDVSLVNLNGQPLYATHGFDLTAVMPPQERIVARVIAILVDEAHAGTLCEYRLRPGFHVGRTTAPPRDGRRGGRMTEREASVGVAGAG